MASYMRKQLAHALFADRRDAIECAAAKIAREAWPLDLSIFQKVRDVYANHAREIDWIYRDPSDDTLVPEEFHERPCLQFRVRLLSFILGLKRKQLETSVRLGLHHRHGFSRPACWSMFTT